MKKININYIFSIGRRCNSNDFLRHYNLTKFRSPFDYAFIDFENCLIIIKDKFNNLLNDIVILDIRNRTIEMINNKNYDKYWDEYKDLLNKKIRYIAQDYNENGIIMRINQNYTQKENLTENIYDWNKLCVYVHHDFKNKDIIEKFNKAINIFNYNYEKNKDKIMLFHITQIIEDINYNDIIYEMISTINKYKIDCYYTILIFSPGSPDRNIFKNNILFIIRSVPPYSIQSKVNEKFDNSLNFTNYNEIYETMLNYFNFDIYDK